MKLEKIVKIGLPLVLLTTGIVIYKIYQETTKQTIEQKYGVDSLFV